MNKLQHLASFTIWKSDIPTILGLNEKNNQSLVKLAFQKLGYLPKDYKDYKDYIKNEYTEYGILMEPKIREFLKENYKANYEINYEINYTENYKTKNWIYVGICDGIDYKATIPLIEIKTFGNYFDYSKYEPQCRFYMELFDVDCCLLVGYKRPDDFYSGSGEYNEKDFNTKFNPKNLRKVLINRDTKKWEKIEDKIDEFLETIDFIITKNYEFCKIRGEDELIQTYFNLKEEEEKNAVTRE